MARAEKDVGVVAVALAGTAERLWGGGCDVEQTKQKRSNSCITTESKADA